MAAITINDLDINQELEEKALANIMGGRWVWKTYRRTYTRYYRRRVTRYYTYRRTYTYTYRRRVWV